MSRDALRRVLLIGLWVGLVASSVILAPEGDGADGQRVLDFFAFRGEAITVAIFNALGVWPLALGAVLLRDPRQRVPMWPFVVLSLATGGFSLLPGLVLRGWHDAGRHPLHVVLRVLTGRALGAFVLLASLGLATYAVWAGDFTAYFADNRSSVLVSTMSLDFVALCLTWPIILASDARRHPGPGWRVVVGLLPVVGPGVWLLMRGEARRSSEPLDATDAPAAPRHPEPTPS